MTQPLESVAEVVRDQIKQTILARFAAGEQVLRLETRRPR